MKRFTSFSHKLDLKYSDNDNCQIISRDIRKNNELQRICRSILGRNCNTYDLEIFHENQSYPLIKCNSWKNIHSSERTLRFTNNSYNLSRPPHIKYLIDPYFTRVDVLNATFINDHPIRFCVDTGNEGPTGICASRFKNLIVKPLMATTDMIFMYNVLTKENKIEPINIDNNVYIDNNEYGDIIHGISYPKTTQEYLYSLCKNMDERYLKLIGFTQINGVGGGHKYLFKTTNIQLKIQGIDKVFEIECDVDETQDPDILLGYPDISILYENGIDIGFNQNILYSYHKKEILQKSIRFYSLKFCMIKYLMDTEICPPITDRVSYLYDEAIKTEARYKYINDFRVPAYKL